MRLGEKVNTGYVCNTVFKEDSRHILSCKYCGEIEVIYALSYLAQFVKISSTAVAGHVVQK